MKKTVVFTIIMVSVLIFSGCASAGSKGADLTGKVWMLESLNGSALVTGTFISAEFSTDGKVSGTAGCNSYSGQYTVTGSEIQISSPASTMMACDQPIMDQESAYFQALANAKSFKATKDTLSLKDASGTVVASYKAQNEDLSGTSWTAISYNNGKQAVVSVSTGSDITLDFSTDGKVSGFAGCNNYNGAYKVDGQKITIGPLASTMMACDTPEGVMDQEVQYLAALQSAATYSIMGNRLELRTADGAMAADFTLK